MAAEQDKKQTPQAKTEAKTTEDLKRKPPTAAEKERAARVVANGPEDW